MIKTHKPRGQFWTCPSVFQQSKEIRNIKFEDCTPPEGEILGSDSHDDLRPSERAAKRRKIEKLAHDFLNGEPLIISSARPCTTSLKGTVEWNERSRTCSKWSMPVVEKVQEDSELWVDIENPWEAPQKSRSKRKAKRKSKPAQPQTGPQHESADVETVTEVQEAASGCKPARHTRAAKVSSEPSTEAVKQAAALRARKLQRAAAEVPCLSDGVAQRSTPDPANAEPRSEPTTIARPRYFRTRKPPGAEWLLRRHTTLHDLSPDESIDELSRSAIETPSRTQQQSVCRQSYSSPIPSFPVGEPDPVSSDTVVCEAGECSSRVAGKAVSKQAQPDEIVKSSADPLSLSFSQKLAAAAQPDPSGSVANGSYHTAPEATVVEPVHAEEFSQNDSEADSQTQLLKRQGIRAAPRKSWASMNQPASTAPDELLPTKSAGSNKKTSNDSAIRQSLQESAQNAGKPQNGKRAKSASNSTPQTAGSTTRRRSAPSESQNAQEQMASLPVDQQRRMSAFRVLVEKPAYTEVQPAQQGDTPFMFRKKRTSKAGDGNSSANSTVDQEKTGRRRVTFPSSEDAPAKARKGSAAQQVAAEPPMLDMSLGHDSSFGMRLNMALVDEHLNAVLPNEPGSSRRSSAVKRALRQELINFGAEVSRVPGEPTSSQVCMQRDQISVERDREREPKSDAENAWSKARQSSKRNVEDAPTPEDGDIETQARQSLRHAVEHARRESISGLERADDDRQSAQTQWPGTQAALAQAHRDLFTSPEKPAAIGEAVLDDTTDSTKMTTTAPVASAAREPLRELSQEQMPGTQAMMEGWSPWSTIKKPKGATGRAMADSPTLRGSTARRSRSARFSSTVSDPFTAVDDASRRRSSLRFSTTTSDSPLASSRLQYSITKPSSSESVEKGGVSSISASTPKPILKGAGTHRQLSQNEVPLTWEQTTVASFEAIQSDPTGFSSTGPPTEGQEAGQGHLLREDSDLDRTINELTADVLSTSDMNGVMSQRA